MGEARTGLLRTTLPIAARRHALSGRPKSVDGCPSLQAFQRPLFVSHELRRGTCCDKVPAPWDEVVCPHRSPRHSKTVALDHGAPLPA